MIVDSLDKVAAVILVAAEASDAVEELEAVVDPEMEVRGLDCPGPAD